MSQFLLPDLGEGLEEAQLVQWLVREGQQVQLNEPLCQVETAKAMVDIPSPYAGTVEKLHARPGDTVPVGTPLITVREVGASASPAATGRPTETAAAAAATASNGDGHGPVLVGYGTEGPAQTFARRRRAGPHAPLSPQPQRERENGALAEAAAPDTLRGMMPAQAEEPKASPLVRKMARERGVDLATLRGTGPGGRIRVEDLEAALAAGTATAGRAPSRPAALAADEERISTVGLRKAIAARMVKAATTIPHFTEYGQFDASALSALRQRLRVEPAYVEHRLTFLPFFVRALVDSVRAHPIMNSRWDEEGNAIVVKRGIHVGIATDTERGLLVPVIHDAHTLDLPAIAAECDRMLPLARSGKLDARALSGSTITITNVGAAGPVDTGAPLINPPEACIVGFGAIKPRPTVVGDALEVRPGAWISISCDHRIVDGATAAQFLGTLVKLLEEPSRLL